VVVLAGGKGAVIVFLTPQSIPSSPPSPSRKLLVTAPGVVVVDVPEESKYPMPLSATAQYDVEVGRIRQSLVFGKKGLDLFVCGDQLLRGAASNAVFIAEAIVFPEK